MLNAVKTISADKTTVLIAGAADFIGANLGVRLLEDSACNCIVGVDNMSDYYDPTLKKGALEQYRQCGFCKLDILAVRRRIHCRQASD
ncbi:MAG: hypothetical protein IKF56_00835 [Eggerthellaceae bacterium]|nr:hypothetical protein [Eggerthellaceae bacterium]